MPFEVFRRNQRMLIAVFGLLAMISFVLSDSLPRLLNAGNGGGDQQVANCTARRCIGAISTRWPASGAGPTSSSIC